jgi:type VI secretion system secreted protein VgrG
MLDQLDATYVQADRLLTVTSPLGNNKLLLVSLNGEEQVSQLFRFELELIADNDTEVPFDKILGHKVTAHIAAPGGGHRHISGICCAFSQGGRDAYFTSYQAVIVPEVWFLTRKAQSRIFQAKTVKEILKKVFTGFQVHEDLRGDYQPRNYCVQYRETDFNFASRLMEEEGIFYFFEHEQNSHTMVYADHPGAHQNVPFESTATFAPLETTNVVEDRVTEWQKTQSLRSTKFLLWDHSFELPHKHLEAEETLTRRARVGTTSHNFLMGDPNLLEVYDWPGEYAQRFDGVNPARQATGDVQKVFQDNKRTVEIRMQQEAAEVFSVVGVSKLRQLTAGFRFKLKDHFNADGDYVLTSVRHDAQMTSNYRSHDMDEMVYENGFTCLPDSVPFRPQRVTPKPVIQGTQTAVVVGPKGEEIYTDKYGRVKVQFHWDREGKNDEKSSCWIRVAQPMAGRRWGSSFWPRVGQEVLVDFLEGDPDRPVIIGCLYNADQMPPYLGEGPDDKHKDDNRLSGVKSSSTKEGKGFNEWRFDDTRGKEQVFVHAQRNMDLRVEADSMEKVGGSRHLIVGGKDKDGNLFGDQCEQVYRDKHLHVLRHLVKHVEGNIQFLVGLGSAPGGGDYDVHIEKNLTEKVGQNLHLTVGAERQEKIGTDQILEAGNEIHLKAGMKVVIDAGVELTVKGAGGFLKIDASGVTIEGTFVKINCGGAAGAAKSASPGEPKDAKPNEVAQADQAATGQKST